MFHFDGIFTFFITPWQQLSVFKDPGFAFWILIELKLDHSMYIPPHLKYQSTSIPHFSLLVTNIEATP